MLEATVSFLIKGTRFREGQEDYISVQIRSVREKTDALKIHNFVTSLPHPGLYNFILRAYPNSVPLKNFPQIAPSQGSRAHRREPE
jgi:hypothetical protein